MLVQAHIKSPMDDNESTVSRRDDAGGRISSEDTESLPRSSHSGEEENTTNHNNGWKENTTSPTMVAVEDGCESSPTSSSSSDSLPDGEFVPAKLANGSDNSLKTGMDESLVAIEVQVKAHYLIGSKPGYGESLETVPGYEGDYDDDVGTESVQSINMENVVLSECPQSSVWSLTNVSNSYRDDAGSEVC